MSGLYAFLVIAIVIYAIIPAVIPVGLVIKRKKGRDKMIKDLFDNVINAKEYERWRA